MSCTICGRVTLPGAKLCVQCKAALKRARQQTVSQVEPLRRRSKGTSKRRSIAQGAPGPPIPIVAPPAVESTAPRRLRLPATLVVMGALICAGGYFGDQLSNASAVQNLVRTVPAPSPPGLASALPAAASAEPPRSVEGAPAERPLADVIPPAIPVPKPTDKAARKSRNDASQVATVSSLADFGPVTEPAPGVVTAPPPVAPVPEAPPPDRWQSMSEAIAACGRSDGFIAGVICEQRVRLQYCDGYWDQVAQCPGRVAKDSWQ